MWTMTKYGFFSVSCARKGNGEPWQQINLDSLMVRARSSKHLQALMNRFSGIERQEIYQSLDADYRFRIFVNKKVWAGIMHEMALELDYDNFKGKVGQSMPEDGAYLSALHSTWATMHRLQS